MSTFEICKFVDSYLKSYEGNTTVSFEAVLLQILRKIPFEKLYVSSNFDLHEGKFSHKYEFVKQVVRMYMNMKSVKSAKILKLKTHDPIRHIYKKLVKRAGQ